MTLILRPASLSEDRQELIGLLERNLPGMPMRAHFPWRHEGNPAGPGWCWALCDRQSGIICAMTSVFPRRMFLDGRLISGGQVGEFAVDSAYRSLGPAVMLQRATFQLVDSGVLALCYDCPPHSRGMSTFVRLGMRPSCEVTRYALLLRSDEVLRTRIGKGVWTKPVIAAANLLLRIRRTPRRIAELEVCRLDGMFGEEFTRLDKAVSSSGTIRTSRAADLLNWAYRKRSGVKFEVLVARRKGELLAFLAFIVYGDKRAAIFDVFGLELAETGPALLEATIEICRREGIICLQGYCSETSALKPLFEAAGFRPRERAARVVSYVNSGELAASILTSGSPWPVGQAEVTV